MSFRIIAVAAASSLVFAGLLAAKPYDPERSAPQSGFAQCREICQGGCMSFDKQINNKQMIRQHRHEMRMQRRMARQHMRELRHERLFGGPGMAPGGPMAPGPEMRRQMMERRHQELFGGPGGPMAPAPEMRRRMKFQDQNFGPMMRPDRPMGPPPHMRFRDGKRAPRAL